MKILQIATPAQATFAGFAVKNKKGAWIVERLPVVFFGLIPIEGPDGKTRNDNSIEPIVFGPYGAVVGSSLPGYLGLDVMATANAVPKDWGKELVAYLAIVEAKASPEIKPTPEVKTAGPETKSTQ